MTSNNRYISAGRYNQLPTSECNGIATSLKALIASTNDAEYRRDAIERLEALTERISRG